MRNRAVYPGSFDPVTFGHLDLIRRGSRLFDDLIVAIGTNATKNPLFTAEERLAMIEPCVRDLSNVTVRLFSGLVVEFARKEKLNVILRGVRTVSDFETEFQMALTNRSFAPELETVFVMPAEHWSYTSSRLIKEVVAVGGSVAQFVPDHVSTALEARLKPRC